MQNKKLVTKGLLGNSNFQASRIGLGCMGLSGFYGNPASEQDALNLIGKAIEQGVNFFDSAQMYLDNEELLAKAIKKFGRNKFFIATKVPPMKFTPDGKLEFVSQTKEHIKNSCDVSLKRLQIDQIDLFYEHRVDPTIPIEVQAEAFKELVEEGKIRFYGLSEASADTIRRAHKVHPLTAIQEEYSLQSRDIETNGVLDTCKELGIALVAYSPLGRGLLTGTINKPSDLDEKDWRLQAPRFKEENMKQNQIKIDKLNEIATSLKATSGQIALTWLLSKGDNIFPIPGTKKDKYLTENNQSCHIKLTSEQIKIIDELFPPGSAVGERYDEQFIKVCSVDTPQLQK